MATSTKAETDSLDSLSALATYVQAAETRSFTQAARVLGLTASAVGKTVARLEASLGVRLFHRSTRSISLTPDGEVFLESCRRVLSEIDSVERELAGNQASPRGKLRVSLPYLSGLFGKVLAGYYPGSRIPIYTAGCGLYSTFTTNVRPLVSYIADNVAEIGRASCRERV